MLRRGRLDEPLEGELDARGDDEWGDTILSGLEHLRWLVLDHVEARAAEIGEKTQPGTIIRERTGANVPTNHTQARVWGDPCPLARTRTCPCACDMTGIAGDGACGQLRVMPRIQNQRRARPLCAARRQAPVAPEAIIATNWGCRLDAERGDGASDERRRARSACEAHGSGRVGYGSEARIGIQRARESTKSYAEDCAGPA